MREEEGVRVVIVTGAGGGFSEGRESFPTTAKKWTGGPSLTWIQPRRAASFLAEVEVPVIAAINGNALDHGLELALACDLRIAARGAVLGITDVSRGRLPWDGATQRLPRLIGSGRALEMLLTSRLVSAEEARSMGLVNVVVEPGEVKPAAQELALSIARTAPIAARYIKEAARHGLDMALDQGLRLEADLNIILQSTKDRTEGIRTFQEKGQPHFTGE